jgi:tRNA threonylcarbamoyladenosine biosynthesis protein TsaB
VKLLAIDTTETACSAALLIDDAIEERFEVAPRRHSDLLLPMMEDLLQGAGLHLQALDALAFARGPGSFTGVRIATAIVQGTAFGAGLPVVPVSSLQALAQGCCRRVGATRVLTALDARMKEIYWCAFVADAHGLVAPLIGERVCAPGDVPLPEGGAWYGAGSGWEAYRDILAQRCGDRVLTIDVDARIHAADVARLAALRYLTDGGVSAENALPVYLRDQVAWKKT